MKSKFLIFTLMLLLCTFFLCSYSFANNMANSTKNALMNVGNAIGDSANKTRNAIANGTENLANGANNLVNGTMNGVENATDGNGATLDTTNNTDYTATRTATDNTGLFGMSNTMLTWLILGIVGAIIVGLVWYYAAQYEHKNYNND